MRKFSVSIPWHCSVIVIVEANDETEALDKAYEQANTMLCHQCSDHIDIEDVNDDCEPGIEEL